MVGHRGEIIECGAGPLRRFFFHKIKIIECVTNNVLHIQLG